MSVLQTDIQPRQRLRMRHRLGCSPAHAQNTAERGSKETVKSYVGYQQGIALF